MKAQLFFLCLLLCFLFSCKKNNNGIDTPSSSGNKKLTKQVSTDGTYTTTTSYNYDADGKLARLQQTETGGGSSYNEGLRIVRKAGGMIDKVIFLNSSLTDSATLTLVSNGQQYSSAEWSEARYSTTTTHKTTFVYDSEGHIADATQTDYYGSTADPKNRITFTYTNNNLASEKHYRISGGTNILSFQYDMEYDQKPNPVAFGVEWIVLSFINNSSPWQSSINNVTKVTVKQTGSSDVIVNCTYNYNSQNLPVSATSKSNDPSQPTETTTFAYE